MFSLDLFDRLLYLDFGMGSVSSLQSTRALPFSFQIRLNRDPTPTMAYSLFIPSVL